MSVLFKIQTDQSGKVTRISKAEQTKSLGKNLPINELVLESPIWDESYEVCLTVEFLRMKKPIAYPMQYVGSDSKVAKHTHQWKTILVPIGKQYGIEVKKDGKIVQSCILTGLLDKQPQKKAATPKPAAAATAPVAKKTVAKQAETVKAAAAERPQFAPVDPDDATVHIRGTLYTDDDATIGGDLTVKKDATITGNFSVESDATVEGNFTAKNDATVEGNFTVKNDATVQGNLLVDNDAAIGGNLWVQNEAEFEGDVLVHGDLYVEGTIHGNGAPGGDVDSLYDVVIRTQEEFEALYESEDWFGARSVAFVGKEFINLNEGKIDSFYKADGNPLTIPETVTDIVGIHFPIIEIELSSVWDYAFGYAKPLQIELDEYGVLKRNISGITVFAYPSGPAAAIKNCRNVYNCSAVYSIASKEGDSNQIASAFSNCYKIENCTGIAIALADGGLDGAGFYQCFEGSNCVSFSICRKSAGFLECVSFNNTVALVGFNVEGAAYARCSLLNNAIGVDGSNNQNYNTFYNCSGLTGCIDIDNEKLLIYDDEGFEEISLVKVKYLIAEEMGAKYAHVAQDLEVLGNTSIGGELSTGSLDVNQSAVVRQDLDVQGNTLIKGDLTVEGTINGSGGGGGEDSALYDVVIRTQTEFQDLFNSPTWLDAASVAFIGNGGSFEFLKGDDMPLTIPSTVKQIAGFNSAKITISGAEIGLQYETLPEGSDYSIRDLTIQCTNIVSAVVIGVLNCKNLSNVTVSCNTLNEAIGIQSCTKLSNCTVRVSSISGGVNGIVNCTYLTQCLVRVLRVGPTAMARGYFDSKYISDCMFESQVSIPPENLLSFGNCTAITHFNTDIDADFVLSVNEGVNVSLGQVAQVMILSNRAVSNYDYVPYFVKGAKTLLKSPVQLTTIPEPLLTTTGEDMGLVFDFYGRYGTSSSFYERVSFLNLNTARVYIRPDVYATVTYTNNQLIGYVTASDLMLYIDQIDDIYIEN